MEKFRERVQQLKKKRPGYGEILDFYHKVREGQDKIKASLKIKPIKLKKEWKELLAKEGFSLIQKEDFPLDIEASIKLFQSLCQIGKEANPHLAEQIIKIKEAIDDKKINLEKLLKQGVKEQKIEQMANEFGLDKKVFSFLIQNSIKPSIEAGMEKLRSELDPETWLKGYCSMCGSPPSLSLLKGEGGKRYLLCSYCGYQWRADRMFCPFCNNKEQESLHYFYGEGEETYRIDLCDQCHQYIKTIDLRKMEASDPSLEDVATLHLDILASQKGYKRPVPNPWTP
ncbi:MAG: formate dehydrogenase accessory protein FdhE [Thermodesulfobacteriota bacterium]